MGFVRLPGCGIRSWMPACVISASCGAPANMECTPVERGLHR
uniref:Lipoprotein n=1 Tax=Arundo donax TaxID=35708 RepID=A0A0A9A1E5_ARUDO